MENTHIEWADHTFNPWIGCTQVSPGCKNCYALTLNKRWAGGKNWGKGAKRRRTSAANWKEPLKWNKQVLFHCPHCNGSFEPSDGQLPVYTAGAEKMRCMICGYYDAERKRPRVFCASLADWLDDEVPIEWLADLLKLIHDTPHLDWLLLTKRPGNWRSRVTSAARHMDESGLYRFTKYDACDLAFDWLAGKSPANIWIGTTVEDQARADERIPQLLAIPAKVRFLSCEPLLESVDLFRGCFGPEVVFARNSGPALRFGVDWVICGGESGPGARPMHPDWARGLRDQCTAAGVPFFFKQWGEWAPFFALQRVTVGSEGTPTITIEKGDFTAYAKLGKKAAGRLLDGREWNEVPA